MGNPDWPLGSELDTLCREVFQHLGQFAHERELTRFEQLLRTILAASSSAIPA